MKKFVFIFITVLSGIIVLLGIFLPSTVFNGVKQELLNWTIILSSLSMIIAIIGLLTVHWKKIFTKEKADYASIFFLIGFLLVLITGIFGQFENKLFLNLTKTVIISVESSLLAVLSLTLAYASYRFFQKKQDFLSIIFGVSTILFLLIFSGILSAGENSPLLENIVSGINSLPIAGSAGILIGIAIGAIVTSLRALFGFIHPFIR
jgi:hypothetical protein